MVLRIGQKVPEFALPDSGNKVHSLADFLKDGPVILAFFPFAFSGVCDKEMCTFRDSLSYPQGFHARVVGISVDSVFSLKAFAQTYSLPFPLLSDFNRKVTKLYGVLHDPWVALGYRGVAKRSVFVVDSRGLLRYRWVTDVPTEEPPYSEVAKAAQKLSA
ncbi:MAG TPA: redoxin domain-containing protein [Nitrososphaerales archaeon]|nr:redoxin domain-containing protein [Nitrososphaerales archaeon]